MGEIIKIKLKDVMRNAYSNLEEIEKEFKIGDLLQEANSSQDIEFTLLSFGEDKGGKFAICKSPEGINRTFFIDAIKKSSKQIEREEKEIKRLKKAEIKKIKDAKDLEKKERLKLREEKAKAKELKRLKKLAKDKKKAKQNKKKK